MKMENLRKEFILVALSISTVGLSYFLGTVLRIAKVIALIKSCKYFVEFFICSSYYSH